MGIPARSHRGAARVEGTPIAERVEGGFRTEGSEPLRSVIVSTGRNTVQTASIEGPANAGTASGTEAVKQALK
jgi:hypothetical protein